MQLFGRVVPLRVAVALVQRLDDLVVLSAVDQCTARLDRASFGRGDDVVDRLVLQPLAETRRLPLPQFGQSGVGRPVGIVFTVGLSVTNQYELHRHCLPDRTFWQEGSRSEEHTSELQSQ